MNVIIILLGAILFFLVFGWTGVFVASGFIAEWFWPIVAGTVFALVICMPIYWLWCWLVDKFCDEAQEVIDLIEYKSNKNKKRK